MASFKTDGKAIFTVFIGAIICLALIATISTAINNQTNTFSRANVTVTAPAVNGTLDLKGRELIGTPTVLNATNATSANLHTTGVIISTQTSSTTGLRTVQLTVNDTESAYAAQSVNVSYTYRPDGYLSNSGARTTQNAGLIILALALTVFVLVVFIKYGYLGNLYRSS